MNLRAVVFDAYGTLFDVHSVVRGVGDDLTGDRQTLSALWRQKQLEYTWLRSLMGRYEDFWEITYAALRSAVNQLKIEATNEQLDGLMQAYLVPSVFSDAKIALESIRGVPMAILSNGSPKMLEAAVGHNGLQSYFTEVISVDRVQAFSSGLCAGARDLEGSSRRDPFRLLEFVGRGRSQGVRLQSLLVQPVWDGNGRTGVRS